MLFLGKFFCLVSALPAREEREREGRESEREKKLTHETSTSFFPLQKTKKCAPPPEQANPALSLMVLQFHMLPNPIPTDQFVNGYSFNTVNS